MPKKLRSKCLRGRQRQLKQVHVGLPNAYQEGLSDRAYFSRTCANPPAAQYTQLTKRVKRLDRTIETKSGVIQVTDGTECGHNALNMVNNTFLGTTNCTLDDENSRGQRIGDKVTLVGVKFSMMLELNERYSDVTFRLMVIRSAKGDTSTNATLWDGASGNKMLDTFNTERFTVLYTKHVKMRAHNMSISASGFQIPGFRYVCLKMYYDMHVVCARTSRIFLLDEY